MDRGVDEGIVEKSGSWYSYGGERIGQGREKARTFLKENPDACQRLAEEVYLAKGLKLSTPAIEPAVQSDDTDEIVESASAEASE